MEQTRFEQIDRLLAAALAIAPEARAAFLTEACAGDDALRAEVEALLAEEARAEVLDKPAVAYVAAAFAVAPLQSERLLDHFQLAERIGTGGMGEVWRAKDTRLDRVVALKFLPPEFAADP